MPLRVCSQGVGRVGGRVDGCVCVCEKPARCHAGKNHLDKIIQDWVHLPSSPQRAWWVHGCSTHSLGHPSLLALVLMALVCVCETR